MAPMLRTESDLPLSRNVPGAVDFPARDGTFQFRQQLEAAYRDTLRRPSTTSFVDIEGTIVWTQEYLRYRVNGCGHQDAIIRVQQQIQGRGIQPICTDFTGSSVSFPPRNEPFAFRQELERIYRDELRRSAVETFLDAEGDIVWTQEYLRYRLNGCSQMESSDRVLAQVSGGPVLPTCASAVPTVTNFVTNVTVPGATTTLVSSPRPNAGAGPIVLPSASGNLINLSASQPVDRIIVSVNTTAPSTTRVGSLAVVGSYFEVRLPAPRTQIPVTIQGTGAFNLEFAASLGGGPLGQYIPIPFNAPASAVLQMVFSPNPAPWTDSGACGTAPAGGNVWRFRTTFVETGGVAVTLTGGTAVSDDGGRAGLLPVGTIPAHGVLVTDISCQASASPLRQTVRRTFTGTDANGRAVSFLAPDLVLLARP